MLLTLALLVVNAQVHVLFKCHAYSVARAYVGDNGCFLWNVVTVICFIGKVYCYLLSYWPRWRCGICREVLSFMGLMIFQLFWTDTHIYSVHWIVTVNWLKYIWPSWCHCHSLSLAAV